MSSYIALNVNKHRLNGNPLCSRDGFSYFRSGGGVDKYLGGAAACFGRGVVAMPGKAKKKFNKICFLGLHGEIWDHNIGNFTNLVVRIIKYETIKSKYI